jgi:xylan 1,4-beta-xylosidase
MTNIVFDLKNTGNPINKVWNFGYNTCHAQLLLRDDLPLQIKKSKESGFKYIRFHNIFSEAVGVYTENEAGEAIYNFENFDKIFDTVIQNGYLPFMEISFCPEAMKKSDKTIMFYKASTSIPASYEKWDKLIEKMVSHIIERYGIECAKRWYFEVWNEPDLIFFDGNMDDYFELYDHTVLAIKKVNPSLKVGGPATSKCAWISEFINHIETGSEISGFKSLPCDFIATHAYPSDLPFYTKAHGDVKLQKSDVLTKMFTEVKEKIENSSLKGIPLIMGEWNSSAGPLAFNHDEKNNGAFIIKTLNELKNVIDGSLYWNLSDIFEEFGFQYKPFHGGYGLFTVNNIPKSSYNAFKLLNMVDGEEIVPQIDGKLSEGVGILSSFDKNKNIVNILFYYYMEPDASGLMPQDISISLQGIETKTVSYKSFEISDEAGSSYEWWKKIGSPDYLTPETMQFLYEKSKMPESEKALFADKVTGAYGFSETLCPGDVKLIQISNI